jgi:hypothetical protein
MQLAATDVDETSWCRADIDLLCNERRVAEQGSTGDQPVSQQTHHHLR